MILVTGAYGFIGSNFVKYLNSKNISNIIVSDTLKNGKQFKNLSDASFEEFVSPDNITSGLLRYVTKVFHFGAISSTTEWDGEKLLTQNYNFTIDLLNKCIAQNIPVSYSSSASVYGNGAGPLNLYAYSKYLVDKWVSKKLKENSKLRIQGFRYFNVYGPNEWHKENQASPFYQFEQQALLTGEIRIFEGSENYKRDFVPVEDVCKIQYALSTVNESGIFDLGTGSQKSFKDVAEIVASKHDAKIITIPFPEHLKEHYQYNTLADMSKVKSTINRYNIDITA